MSRYTCVIIISNTVEIKIKYKLLNLNEIHEISLTEETYFEPISRHEDYEDDSIPRFDDCRMYLSTTNKDLFEWDELVISGSYKSDKKIKTEYYAKGESSLIYRIDKGGYELIIQSFILSNDDIFISRMERKGINSPWINTNFNLGVNFKGGIDEEWYNLKQGELKDNKGHSNK